MLLKEVAGSAFLTLAVLSLSRDVHLQPTLAWAQGTLWTKHVQVASAPQRFPNAVPRFPLALMTSEETQAETAKSSRTPTTNKDAPQSLPRSGPEAPDADTNADDQANAAKQGSLFLVAGLGTVGAGVSAAVRGTGSGPASEEEQVEKVSPVTEEPTEFLWALNILWYTLAGMLVTLLGGLAYEAYLGPLRLSILHDLLVSLLAVVSGVLWVRMFKTLASEGIIGRKLSRKLIHISSAPLFLLCWPLYSISPTARWVAVLPPLANSIRLLSAGLGKEDNQDAVQAISRQGGRKELLQGPLYYVLVLLAVTALGWRTSWASYVSISLMAGGDGIADIVGRRFGKVKLPWNPNKSWAGSVAMFLGGFLLSTAFGSLFSYAGFLPALSDTNFLLRLSAVCLLTTITESIPNSRFWPLDDNVSVPLVAMLLSALLFHTI